MKLNHRIRTQLPFVAMLVGACVTLALWSVIAKKDHTITGEALPSLVPAGAVECDPNRGPNLLAPPESNLMILMTIDQSGQVFHHVQQTLCNGGQVNLQQQWLQVHLGPNRLVASWEAPVQTQWQAACLATNRTGGDAGCIEMAPGQAHQTWSLEPGEMVTMIAVYGRSAELAPAVTPANHLGVDVSLRPAEGPR